MEPGKELNNNNKALEWEFGGSMTRGEAIGFTVLALLALLALVVPWFVRLSRQPVPAVPIRCSPMCACPAPCVCVHGGL